MNRDKRPDWDTYFFNMLDLIATRSTCLRRKIGVIITIDNRIVATGYNGQPPGIEHCTDRGFCLRDKLKVQSGQRHELCRVIHAEQNAIHQASQMGVRLQGATIYSNLVPCSLCTKAILSVGISRVVYKGVYDDPIGDELRKEAQWVKFDLYKPPIESGKKVKLYRDEIIKPLKDFDGFYISNYGRIFKNCIFDGEGNVVDTGEHIQSKFEVKENQYFIALRDIGKKIDDYIPIAYLVANTWLGNPNNAVIINWKDKNTANCHVDNLEWYD
jgi:dCMP deaminase